MAYNTYQTRDSNPTMMVPSETVVSLDTLRRALHAVEVAAQIIEDTGADQYVSSFRQSDGTLGGKVVLAVGGFVVDFGLLGEDPRQVGG